ncbi:probable galactarate/D-glucarate transporter GudP [Ptychodera flava]|uniref:probable galactarate/D-glucarate transporter GudP n=1 Tax=Ptychodera flava TaxID=63121 RepID=UPI00396A2A51
MGRGDWCRVIRENKYALYVATLMMLLFMTNQLGRYVLIATNVEMANDIHFGDKVCNVSNSTAVRHYIDTHNLNESAQEFCKKDHRCEDPKFSSYCAWQYTGTGLQYQLLAGPLFNVFFSVAGIPVSLVMERTNINRKNVIIICAVMWSAMVILTGFSRQYWHLVVTRLGLAIFEAPFPSFAASIISSYCIQSIRGLGLAIFIWGVYIGLSIAFFLNVVVDLLGWRWAYWISGIPGIVLAGITLCTVKEPAREIQHPTEKEAKIQAEEDDVIYPYEHFMSWIPLAMGTLATLGAGTIFDRAVERRRYYGMLIFYTVTVLISLPMSVGLLYLDPPWCFILIMPNYAVIEVWGSIGMTTIVEQAPKGKHTSALAIHVFSLNMMRQSELAGTTFEKFGRV